MLQMTQCSSVQKGCQLQLHAQSGLSTHGGDGECAARFADALSCPGASWRCPRISCIFLLSALTFSLFHVAFKAPYISPLSPSLPVWKDFGGWRAGGEGHTGPCTLRLNSEQNTGLLRAFLPHRTAPNTQPSCLFTIVLATPAWLIFPLPYFFFFPFHHSFSLWNTTRRDRGESGHQYLSCSPRCEVTSTLWATTHPQTPPCLSASSLLALGPTQTESSSPVPLPLCSIFLSRESFRHHHAASGPIPTTAPGRCRCPSANENNSLVNAKILLKKFTGQVCSLRFQLISFFQNHSNALACAKSPHTHYFISTPSGKSTIHTSRICKQRLKD